MGVSNLPRGVMLGFEGEQYARTIRLDCSTEFEKWPDAEGMLFYTRPGEKVAYPAETTRDGNILLWTPDAFAMGKSGSDGGAQVVFTTDGANTVIGKSPVIRLYVQTSLAADEESAADPYESYIARILSAASGTKNILSALQIDERGHLIISTEEG